MSTFGDHTPKDDMLNWIEYVKDEHHLTWPQIVRILAELLAYLIETHVQRGD